MGIQGRNNGIVVHFHFEEYHCIFSGQQGPKRIERAVSHFFTNEECKEHILIEEKSQSGGSHLALDTVTPKPDSIH
jgi:hypothetical protein